MLTKSFLLKSSANRLASAAKSGGRVLQQATVTIAKTFLPEYCRQDFNVAAGRWRRLQAQHCAIVDIPGQIEACQGE